MNILNVHSKKTFHGELISRLLLVNNAKRDHKEKEVLSFSSSFISLALFETWKRFFEESIQVKPHPRAASKAVKGNGKGGS